MSKGKIFLFLLPLCLSFSWATEKIARFCRYDPLLGSVLFTIQGQSYYGPWNYFIWWFKFRSYIPEVFSQVNSVVYMGICCSFIVLFITNMRKEDISHGSARWGTKEDIIKTGLFSLSGVVVGLYDSYGIRRLQRMLRDDSNKHIAVIAPTRSGKGVGIIIPTLLGGWQESVVVNDIKSENWGITAGYRKTMGQKVIKFEPTAEDGSSARWNPLDEIKIGAFGEVAATQNLAGILADYDGQGKLDHWKENAANVIMAVILHLKYAHYANPEQYPNKPNLSSVANFLKTNFVEETVYDDNDQTTGETTLTAKSFLDTLYLMLDFEHVPVDGINIEEWDEQQNCYLTRSFSVEDLRNLYPQEPSLEINPCVHPIVYKTFVEIYSKPAEECGSIISAANTALKEYLDPVLRMNTATSDFSVDDIMNAQKPVSLYLVTPPSDLQRLSPIFRLFFEMMIKRHAKYIGTYVKGKVKPHYKHKCLLLMDEFSALGNLKNFAASLSYIAGYGMKALLIIQGLPQINNIYGKDNQILMNCHLQIFFAPNDNETAFYVEKLLGKKTIVDKSTTYDGWSFFARRHYSQIHVGRELLMAEEIKGLSDQEIIVASGNLPILTGKVKYYEYASFLKKIINPPEESDRIR